MTLHESKNKYIGKTKPHHQNEPVHKQTGQKKKPQEQKPGKIIHTTGGKRKRPNTKFTLTTKQLTSKTFEGESPKACSKFLQEYNTDSAREPTKAIQTRE